MKISDVSRLAQVSPSTIRVWEDKGLLAPRYSPNGTRIYDEEHVAAAMRIKHMRSNARMNIAAVQQALSTQTVPLDAGKKDIEQIGDRLRKVRRARKETIRTVADAIGVDPSLLASLERSSMGLNIPLLQKLSRHYGVLLNDLLLVEQAAQGGEIVTRGQGVVLPRLGIGLHSERLDSGRDVMDCQRWRIEPSVHSNGAYRHEGEEFILIVSGQFEITFEDTRINVLNPGDTIYFKSDVPHSWRNPGADVCEVIWINVGNSF